MQARDVLDVELQRYRANRWGFQSVITINYLPSPASNHQNWLSWRGDGVQRRIYYCTTQLGTGPEGSLLLRTVHPALVSGVARY